MTGNGQAPRILAVGEEPPPLNPAPERRPAAVERSKASKAKGKTSKAKSAGRFAVLNAFVDFTLAGLTRGEMAIWLTIYRDTRDGTAQTAYDDLARRAGLNRRNVGRAIRRLEQLGLLQVVYRGGLQKGPSSYRCRPLARAGWPGDAGAP